MTPARVEHNDPPTASRLLAVVMLTLLAFGDGAAALEVLLRAPNYVFVGDSAVLKCEHGVNTAQLHKVEWLKDGDHKLFQFVRGRNPPFRNFTTPGATLDRSRSNENEILLTNMSLEASGVYSCEVSMETPIYTKPSNDEKLVVIQRQSEDPEVHGVKESYFAGEKVAVNCTSTPTHPPVQIAWLVNGREVSDQLLTRFPEGSTGRQYELTTHGAHHTRPFRTGASEGRLEYTDNYESHESPSLASGGGGNAPDGSKGRLAAATPLEKVQARGGKNDFLASAALGKLYGTTTTSPPPSSSQRGGRGRGPSTTAATAAPTNKGYTFTPGGTGSTSGADVDEDGEESSHLDVYDPPEVVPVVTATATSTTVQLSFVLTDEVVRYLKKDTEDSGTLDVDPTVPKVRLILTCSAIIPETVDGRYADQRKSTVAADVILSEETAARFSSATHSTYVPPRPWMLFLPLLASMFLLAVLQPQHKIPKTYFHSTPSSSDIFQLPLLPRAVYSVSHVQPRR